MSASVRPICILCKHIPNPRLPRRSSVQSNARIPKGCSISTDAASLKVQRETAGSRESHTLKVKNRDIVDYSKKRFYDFEPVELLTKILLHHDKGEFRWPAVRLSPPSSSQEIGVQDGSIGVLGKRMRRKRSPEQVKVARQLFDSIRQFVSRAINGHETNTAQFYREIFFNSSMDPRLKKIAIYTFMRLFAQKDEWVKIYELLREVRTDTAVAPKTFRSIQNYLFILLSMKPPTSDSVELKIWDKEIRAVERPYSDEYLLYLIQRWANKSISSAVDIQKKILSGINQFILDDHHLPDISVSNHALAMLIKAQKSDVTLKEPLDYHKVFFGHFEPHRVNVQSIHLLLELSRDPIEVRQILRLATLASRRNAAILRKTQVEFLNAIRKTSPKFPTSGPAHVVCLSKLMSLQHYLKRHNVPLSNEALMQLLKYSALYGNSTAVRFILNKLNHQNRKFTKTELRTVLRHFPHTGGADQVVSQHRIIGSPDAWVKNEQLSMITGPLRQRVDSEAGLVEYIAALARFEAPAEIWMEWKILEANGFQYRKTTGAIQDSTIFAFVASLIRAGDIRLAKEMIQGIGTSYPGTVSPATIAELLGYLSSRQRGSVDWRWDGSLSYAVGLVVRSRIQWSAVIKRLDKRGITEGWSEGQVNTLKRVVNEVERYLQTIDTGDDIVKAEGQVLKLLDDM